MATYATGTATDPVDLLDKFATFIEANGWTRDDLSVDGSGKRYHAHNGTDYVNIRAAVAETVFDVSTQTQTGTGWAIYMGSGYDGGDAWKDQAGGPIGTGVSYTVGVGMILGSGAVTGYHFFADSASGNNIVAVVERSTGVFTHCGFGTSVTKLGFTGDGQYFFSMGGSHFFGHLPTLSYPGRALTADCPCIAKAYYNAEATFYVKADVDAFTGKWLAGCSSSTTATAGYTGKRCVGSPSTYMDKVLRSYVSTDTAHYWLYQDRNVAAFNSQAVLLPIRVWAARDDGGYSIIGTIPNVYYFHGVTAGYFAAKDVVAIGADNYMVFSYFAVKKV